MRKRLVRNRNCVSRLSVSNKQTKETKMKAYLIVACAAVTLVGCAGNRGGMSHRSSSQTGQESSTIQSTNSSTIQSTNNSTGSSSDRNSGAGSEDNRSPGSTQSPSGSKN